MTSWITETTDELILFVCYSLLRCLPVTMMPTTRCAITSSMAMMAGRLKSNNTVASSRQQTFWTEKFPPLISCISKQLTTDRHQSRPLVFCTSLLLIRTIIILFYQHLCLSISVKVNICFILKCFPFSFFKLL